MDEDEHPFADKAAAEADVVEAALLWRSDTRPPTLTTFRRTR